MTINEQLLEVLDGAQKIGSEVYEESLLIKELSDAIDKLGDAPKHLDATVTEDLLPEGIIAYGVDGKVVGNVPSVQDAFRVEADLVADKENGYLSLAYSSPENTFFNAYSIIELEAPLSDFGDATPEDVMAGKIFTSAEGYCLVGTGQGGMVALPRAEDYRF